MYFNETKEIRQRIVSALVDAGIEEDTSAEIAFHLTDWIDDLESIRAVFDVNNELTKEEISATIHQFLAHVPNHIIAATTLIGYGPIEDVFNVGAFAADDPPLE